MFTSKRLIYLLRPEVFSEKDSRKKTILNDPEARVTMASEFKNPAEKMQLKGQKEAIRFVKKYKGSSDELFQELENYEITDYRELALELVKKLRGELVMDHFLEKLTPEETLDYIDAMIKRGDVEALAQDFKKLNIEPVQKRKEIALKIARTNQGDAVIRHLPQFVLDEDLTVAKTLIEANKGYAVARHIEHFQSDHFAIASAVLEQGSELNGLDHVAELKRHLSQFNLTPQQRKALEDQLK